MKKQLQLTAELVKNSAEKLTIDGHDHISIGYNINVNGEYLTTKCELLKIRKNTEPRYVYLTVNKQGEFMFILSEKAYDTDGTKFLSGSADRIIDFLFI